jgi:hypothetical protein
MIRILTAQSKFPKMKEHMQMMMQDANQAKDVQAISVLVQYLAQRVSNKWFDGFCRKLISTTFSHSMTTL